MTLAAGFVVVALIAPPVLAQPLADPTRPPTDIAAPAVATAPPGPRLSSVLISPGRRLAVVDGETVAVGGKVGDATVVQISETEVVLKRGEETERLTMFSGIEKRPSRPGGKK